MRYWIWWNDLTQGPFELDELTSLKAFSEDLLVCMEDREDWVPASRVADLSSAIEQLRARRAAPRVPPPPPPKRSPNVTPLQGEFFVDPPGQQPLIESDDTTKGPFAYRAVTDELDISPAAHLAGRVTMPFHFMRQPGSNAAVIEMPRPEPVRIPVSTERVITESPVRKDEISPVVLEELQETPSSSSLPPLDYTYEKADKEGNPAWLPWILGVALAFGAVGSLGYWLIDRASTHSAISETQQEQTTKSALGTVAQVTSSQAELPGEQMSTQAPRPSSMPPAHPSFISSLLKRLSNFMPHFGRTPATATPVPSPAGGAAATPDGNTASREMPNSATSSAEGGGMAATSAPAQKASPSWMSSVRAFIFGPGSVAGSAEHSISPGSSSPAGHAVASPSWMNSARALVTNSASAMRNSWHSMSAKRPAAASAANSISGQVRAMPEATGRAVRNATAKSRRAAVKMAAAARRQLQAHPIRRRKPAAQTQQTADEALPAIGTVPGDKPKGATAVPALPGVAPAQHVTSPQVPAADVSSEPSETPNPWKGKENDAITLVQNKALPHSKITIGSQARSMLQEMHEKELIHAAETGERLYLPDKLAWAALDEEGSHYRVYLNFKAMQANGERLQTRSYQFLVDLQSKDIRADDSSTQQDLLNQPAELTFKHNPMATDIDSILGGVDTYNKHKVQLIIVKKNNRNREDRKKIEAALVSAQSKITRAIVYFRRTYSEKALQNIAKAYQFMELLKG